MITGAATHHWSRKKRIMLNGTAVAYHRGLWEECIENGRTLECVSIPHEGLV